MGSVNPADQDWQFSSEASEISIAKPADVKLPVGSVSYTHLRAHET